MIDPSEESASSIWLLVLRGLKRAPFEKPPFMSDEKKDEWTRKMRCS